MADFIDARFKVSISNEKVLDKDTNIWKELTYSVRETNITELAKLLSEHYAFCGVFSNTVNLTQSAKLLENWVQTNLVVVDLDERNKPFSEFRQIISSSDNFPNIMYPTQNDGVKGYRYRAIYCFDAPIVNKELYERIYNVLIGEIDALTEDYNKDNCGRTVNQSFAGSKYTIPNEDVNNVYFSLYEFSKKYKLFDTPNISKCDSRNDKEDSGSEILSMAEEETKERAIVKSVKRNYNAPSPSIMDSLGTFERQSDFVRDFWRMGNRELTEKYIGSFLLDEHTPLPVVSSDTPYIPIPNDYIEIRRYWYRVNLNKEKQTSVCHKIKDGEQRRKKLYINGVIRRLINPDLSFENILFCLVYELYFYIINNGNKIVRNDLFQLAKRIMSTDLTKWEHLKGQEKKTFIVNPDYCVKYQVSKKQAQRIAVKLINDEKIGQIYDCSKTDRENLILLGKYGLKTSLRTLQRFKERNGVKKYGKNLSQC